MHERVDHLPGGASAVRLGEGGNQLLPVHLAGRCGASHGHVLFSLIIAGSVSRRKTACRRTNPVVLRPAPRSGTIHGDILRFTPPSSRGPGHRPFQPGQGFDPLGALAECLKPRRFGGVFVELAAALTLSATRRLPSPGDHPPPLIPASPDASLRVLLSAVRGAAPSRPRGPCTLLRPAGSGFGAVPQSREQCKTLRRMSYKDAGR